jgi:hypothetical protein
LKKNNNKMLERGEMDAEEDDAGGEGDEDEGTRDVLAEAGREGRNSLELGSEIGNERPPRMSCVV